MIERKKCELSLGKTWKMTIWEANWDMSSIPSQIEEQARTARASLNGSGDRALLDFHELVYPWLAAYSTGNVPPLEDAFKLSDDHLDKWYLSVRQTNPDLFPEKLPTDTIVTFRDKSKVSIKSAYYPSVLRRSYLSSSSATAYFLDHPEDTQEYARLQVYGKLSCCSTGDVPSYAEIKEWPASELQKWYGAVLQQNPYMFVSSEMNPLPSKEENAAELAKKKSAPVS